MVALLELSSCWHVAVSVLCLFLTVSWVGLQCVIVAFPGHTHFFPFKAVAYGMKNISNKFDNFP